MGTRILVGSLREDSLNLLLAREAKSTLLGLGESDVEIIVPDLPLFSQDYEEPGAEPSLPSGRELRESMRGADRLLVCSPEYDRLPSAIILNACHWLSRPPSRPLQGVPVMLAGVSSGAAATRHARPALRLAFERLGCNVLEDGLFIGEGEELLGDEERLESLRAELGEHLPLLLQETRE